MSLGSFDPLFKENDEIIVGPYDAVSKKLKNNMEVQLEE